MTRSETSHWISLAGVALALAYFVMRMTEGGQVVEQSGSALLWAYGSTVGLMIAVFIVAYGLEAVRAERRAHCGPETDERDRAIAARAGRIELAFLGAALNVLIIMVLIERAGLDVGTLPRLEMAADWIFALFAILASGALVKDAAAIVQYRR